MKLTVISYDVKWMPLKEEWSDVERIELDNQENIKNGIWLSIWIIGGGEFSIELDIKRGDWFRCEN